MQLKPGPGLVGESVGAPVDGVAFLLPRQRVEFLALDDTGSIGSILPGVLADFRSLARGPERGAGGEADLRG